jgi:hypothetical protein
MVALMVGISAVAMEVPNKPVPSNKVAQHPPPPLAYNIAAELNAMWDNSHRNLVRENLKQQAIACSLTQELQLAAMVKYNLRLHAMIGNLADKVGQEQVVAAAANSAAVNAQAIVHATGDADRFRLAAPPKYENKKKDAIVRLWLPVIENCLRTAPDANHIRLVSS